MLPEFLSESARRCVEAGLQGQGLAMVPWLEHQLAESRAEEWMWVPALELGSTIYLWHGRFGEGERLARRAVARSLPLAPQGMLYRRALLALARALWAQGRQAEALPIWAQVEEADDPWTQMHRPLFEGHWRGDWGSLSWEERWCRLSGPDPFPLWHEVRWVEGSLAEIPLWCPLPYPLGLDTVASWSKQFPERRSPLLQQVRAWRHTELELRWLGPVGNAACTYSLEFRLTGEAELRPQWLALEVAGCGYESQLWGERNVNLVMLPLPDQPGCWRLLFRGSSEVVSRGTRAVLRLGFEDGRPALLARC